MTRRTIVIDRVLAHEVLAEAARFVPRETGGVLLGVHDRTSRVYAVTDLVAAGPGARRQRDRFAPDGAWQRARIAERYEASGRTLSYLGDWHSHPSGNGPSDLDRLTARRIASTPEARCPHPIFLIATHIGHEWELRGYRLAVRRLRRVPVDVSPS
jgi:integrative and conjugative element protein (TIGR02256 family)